MTQGGGQKSTGERYTGSGKLTYSYTAIWPYGYILTPPKANMERENVSFQEEKIFANHRFFWGVVGVFFFFFPGVYVCFALIFDSCNVGSLRVFFPEACLFCSQI